MSCDCNTRHFLDLGDIIKHLSSTDPKVQETARRRADKHLENANDELTTKYSRTVINKNDSGSCAVPPPSVECQEQFMLAMEKDAEQRRLKRIEDEKVANVLREKGNEAFKKGYFRTALDYYSQAIDVVRDSTVLRTNRAQTYLKLERYEETLQDCDDAIFIFDKCFKAYLHKGNALVKLNRFDEGIECFEKAAQLEPLQQSVIQGIIESALASKTLYFKEQSILKYYEEGSEHLHKVASTIEALAKPNRFIGYYTQQIIALQELLTDAQSRAFFRLQNGFRMFNNHPTLSRVWDIQDEINQDSQALIKAVCRLLSAACKDDAENQELALHIPHLCDQVIKLLYGRNVGEVHHEILNFLHDMSLEETGRIAMTKYLDNCRLLELLVQHVRDKGSIGTLSASILNNIALEKRFRNVAEKYLDTHVIPAFLGLLAQIDNHDMASTCATCICAIGNLAHSDRIRDELACQQGFWETCIKLMARMNQMNASQHEEEILFALQGLMLNLSQGRLPDVAQPMAEDLLRELVALLDEAKFTERAFSMISRVVVVSSAATKVAFELKLPSKFLETMKAEVQPLTKHAVRALVAVTQKSQKMRKTVVRENGLKVLQKLILSGDEATACNAALCLGHCVQLPKVGILLVETNIVDDLLKALLESRSPDVQKNCAIVLARLANSHPRHMLRLRELQGMDVLRSCMPNLQL